ncbi:MAG: RES family NAD+ phosphorylase [Bdellovibrionales bacterium]|nr:RES family NAD+ phosphorylase [Bdellovibrionales bacterium]
MSDSIGTCSYCGSEGVALVEPSKLRDEFELLIGIYEPDSAGKLLVEWFKSDWQLFGHPRMDIPGAKSLLADVLDNGEIVRQLFSPSPGYQSDALARWETLSNELKTKNRYFPSSQIDLERLQGHLGQLPAVDLPTTWYRARLQIGETQFPLDDMTAPSSRLASYGRANPSGIPYLYLGSSPKTAISEIRPHTGERASVATFSIPADLKIVDLREPRKLVSPFLLEDVDTVGFLRVDIGFLERLGEELTRPISPSGGAIDYVPSQYLCEFIKNADYSGVIYRSSVSDGSNLALFDPAIATALTVESFKVDRVDVDISGG